MRHWLRSVKRFVKDHPSKAIIGIGVLAVLTHVVSDLWRPSILIDDIVVPKNFERAGYSSHAFTGEVLAEITRIDNELSEAAHGRRSSNFRSSDQKDTADFEIPGTKIGYKAFIQFLRAEFGKAPTTVGGYVQQSTNGLMGAVLVAQAGSEPKEIKWQSDGNPSAMTRAFAENVLAILRPADLGNYLYFVVYDETTARKELGQCIRDYIPERKSECLVVLGDIENDLSRYRAAEADYRRALNWNGKSAQAMGALASLASDQGHPADARALFERALLLDPTSDSLHYNYSLFELRRSDNFHALLRAKHAVQIDDTNADNLSLLGRLIHDEGDQSGATALLLKAIDNNPKSTTPLTTWACLLYSEGRYREGDEKWNMAIEVQPNKAYVINSWGKCLLTHNQYGKAVEKYAAAAASHPADSIMRANLANAYLQMGQVIEAKGEFERALALSRDAESTVYNDPIPDEDLLPAYPRIYTREVEIYNFWGDSLFNRNDYGGSLQKYQMAMELAPWDAGSHDNVAKALASLGRYVDANRQFAEAVTLSPSSDWLYNDCDWHRRRFRFE